MSLVTYQTYSGSFEIYFLMYCILLNIKKNLFLIAIFLHCYQLGRLISNPMKRIHSFYLCFRTIQTIFMLFVLLLSWPS